MTKSTLYDAYHFQQQEGETGLRIHLLSHAESDPETGSLLFCCQAIMRTELIWVKLQKCITNDDGKIQ